MWGMGGGCRSDGIRWRDQRVSKPDEKLDPQELAEALKTMGAQARPTKFLSFVGSPSESTLPIAFLDFARWNANEAGYLLKNLWLENHALARKCLFFLAETGWNEIFAKLIAQFFKISAINDLLIAKIQSGDAWRTLEERQRIYLNYVMRIKKYLPDSAADLELFVSVAAQERHLLKEQPPAFLSSVTRYSADTKAMLEFGKMLDALPQTESGIELRTLNLRR